MTPDPEREARALVARIRAAHNPDPEEPGSCMHEYPCHVLALLPLLDAAADRATRAQQLIDWSLQATYGQPIDPAAAPCMLVQEIRRLRAMAACVAQAQQECAQSKAREAQLRAALGRLYETITITPTNRDAYFAGRKALAATPDEPLRVVRELIRTAKAIEFSSESGGPHCPRCDASDHNVDIVNGQPIGHVHREDCDFGTALAAAARLFGPTTSR